MPLPFLAPGDLERSGLPGDGIDDHQPARGRGVRAAHVAAARPAQGAGLQRVPPQHRGRPVRDRPRVPATVPRRGTASADGQPLPDEREMLGVALGGRDAAAAVRRVASASPSLLALRGATLRNGAVPGLHPTRSARIVGPGERGPSARSARSTPPCSRPTASTSGSAGSRSTWTSSPACRTRPAHLPAGQHLPVERHRPGLRGRRRGAGRRGRAGAAGRGGRPAGVAAPVRRLPGCGHRGGPAQPGLHACGSTPPTAR